ncbi:MAG: carbamoyl-phosphate synthase, large subunit [Chlamydiales bacterium]|jgi:carbamoyl-phosphate synthase large subunit|nr:carbamoyl-phosphate synthase, large subunit [Chlamydiales bacterium]
MIYRNIKSVLVIGSGPIIVGQACEFDYSGAQACKALREEGCRVILVNSNPATIMTDPNLADVTYIEPIQADILEKIIIKERPEALLPTMGGQTALNSCLELARLGILEKYQIQVIGASLKTIETAENREIFKNTIQQIGLEIPYSVIAYSLIEALDSLKLFNFPIIIRTSFTLGGSGGGIAYSELEFERLCRNALEISPTGILIEETVIGWKEYELELMRDYKGNCVVVCSIENFDPMGVHTGDSITVAPAQTLTDKEYQVMRKQAFAVMETVGITSGGCNVQFAVNPTDGRILVIEINPRVSRSSALASKATGFPIAKVSAKLALGYSLDEIKSDITKNIIPAAFEPSLDYVVVKIPRFNFEKFRHERDELTTYMKSIGEVMAIGKTFQEALQKAICSLEIGYTGLNSQLDSINTSNPIEVIEQNLKVANSRRLFFIADALRYGYTISQIHSLTHIDPWFIYQLKELLDLEKKLVSKEISILQKEEFLHIKQKGFSDDYIAELLDLSREAIRAVKEKYSILPAYKRIDTCAGEYTTNTSYLYSTYEQECEAKPTTQPKIIVIGSGPNRIGQGIEFDYCCVHAIMAVRALNYEAIMVNCNPETVSTDYDVSNRLYFEPLTIEHIISIVNLEKPKGVLVQFGGQTPLSLTSQLHKLKVPILGTSPTDIDKAENRLSFKQMIDKLGLLQPTSCICSSTEEVFNFIEHINYPVLLRPSYIIGGSQIALIKDSHELQLYFDAKPIKQEPILVEKFINSALEIEVEAICDRKSILIVSILEQFEEVGIHSGDSSAIMPSVNLSEEILEQIQEITYTLALSLNILGIINIQLAVKGRSVYVLEVNPRASRMTPFVAKATGVPMIQIAVNCILGKSLAIQGYKQRINKCFSALYAVKMPIFSYNKFPNAEQNLGPEMKSTGEIMGLGKTPAEAISKVKQDSKKFHSALLQQNYKFEGVPKDFVQHDLVDIYSLQTHQVN